MNNIMKKGFLTGNQLKIIALVSMTVDHIGAYIFQSVDVLRIIGRLAFPIFAYMIAEGCAYTKNRKRYLLTMLLLGLGCQLVLFAATKSLFQCILITFSLSIGLIYLLDYARRKRTLFAILVFTLALTTVFWITECLSGRIAGTDFGVDYGFFGVFLPVAVFGATGKSDKLLWTTVTLCLLAYDLGYYSQWFALGAVPLLALYNGQRGKEKLKNLFYIYYPVHLVVIYLAGFMLNLLVF